VYLREADGHCVWCGAAPSHMRTRMSTSTYTTGKPRISTEPQVGHRLNPKHATRLSPRTRGRGRELAAPRTTWTGSILVRKL
jgi:hypothetical protein